MTTKRARVSEEISQSLTLSQPTTTTFSDRVHKDADQVTHKFTSKTKGKSKTSNLSYKQFLNIICPKFSILREWYGRSQFDFNCGAPAATSSVRPYSAGLYYDNTSGTSNWPSGTQNWNTFVHLPAANTNFNTYTLQQLIVKTLDVQNLAVTTARSATPLAANTTGMTDQSIQYLGGTVTHTFSNTSTFTLYLEFIISTPRRHLAYQTNPTEGTNALEATLPVQCSLKDKAENVTLTNTRTPINVPASVDQSTDPLFSYDKSDKRLHYNWIVNKPVTVALQPGESTVFTVHLPSFTMLNSEWNTYITAVGASRPLPEFLTFATVVLDVRARAEIAHSNQIDPTTKGYTKLGLGPGTFTHVQKEYHTIRALPYQPQNNCVRIYDLNALPDVTDGVITNQANEIINDTTHQPMDFNN